MMTWKLWPLFDELERTMLGSSRQWPVFDIEHTDDETMLTADVPGMRDSDLEVSVAGSVLTIRGERKGRRPIAFERHFEIGSSYDLDHVKAHIADGVLTITLAKAATAKPRRIELTTGVVDKVKGLLSNKAA